MRYPTDLKSDSERSAYLRGWDDRIKSTSGKGGSATTEAKKLASAANGRKGGRPPKYDSEGNLLPRRVKNFSDSAGK